MKKRKNFLYAGLLLMGIMGALSSGVVRAADTDIVIEATSTAANQTLRVNKYFANSYTVDRGDGSPVETVLSTASLESYKTHTYSTASGYIITLSLAGGATRWKFNSYANGFIPKRGTTMMNVKIVSMPSLADGFGESATNPGDNFFRYFNDGGALESLPVGSFDTSNITTVGNGFFSNFNDGGKLTSLPEGSFDTSNITKVGAGFFSDFNSNGALISLPAGSFDTRNIITGERDFFSYFNSNGAIKSLPEGSFDTSNITTIEGGRFFRRFNADGAITYLPESFKLTSVAYYNFLAYQGAFDSPNYTLTSRKVSDLVAGITPLTSDMDTFSDNQPGRCGVHANWLVTTSDACSITYNFNDEGITSPKINKYTSDTTGAEILSDPVRPGYMFEGWYTQSGDKADKIVFPEMDEETLYARRSIKNYTITFDSNGGSTVDPQIVEENGTGTKPSDPARGGYRFLHRYLSGDNANNAFDFSTPITGDITLVAEWKKRSSSTGGGGGSSSSSSETNTGSTTDQPSSGTNAKDPEQPIDSSDKSSEGQDDGFTQEFIDAYNFAFQNGITTMPTIDQADMTGNLTRIQMAKMLSYYAINIMGKKPDETRNNKFNDVSEKLDADYNSGVILAYQLGIMGINMPNNNFRPNDLVTRGEFVTALSRMIYGTEDGEYENTSKYYTKHIEKLNEEEIIKQIDPSMKELRAYVMIMLKRASEK